jgi:pyruvate,water dikinase
MVHTSVIQRIKALFSSSSAEVDPVVLQESFRSHYRNFRSLLTANNNALELMAEMEQTRAQGQPFGMAFVRGHCTAVSVNVYKMIQSLDELSGGKYQGLRASFKHISEEMEAILARQPAVPAGHNVVPLREVGKEDADLVGDKMANLGEVRKVGLSIPQGFVITAAATLHFMQTSGLQDEINRLLKTLDIDDLEKLYSTSARIQKLISTAPVPEDLAADILEHYRGLATAEIPQPLISMRSSAMEEDRRNVSFAGQYRTQLNISEEFILQTYRDIVASKYQSQAIVYRNQRGFRHQDVVMCVGCMVMVDAVTGGVMFSRSPRNPHSRWVEINAAHGLASPVVVGSVETDFYQVGRERPNEIVRQEPSEGNAILPEKRLHELASIAVLLEEHFGLPQDIEWSIDGRGKVIILQSRPLAQPEEKAEPTGETKTEEACGAGAALIGGLTASAGVAAGPVFVVRSNVDLLEFPAGAVLVVEHSLPEWAALMSRAVAVISEKGHVATHLAIVAREFGIPAIFGMKDATRKLKNGATVTVDATGRCVYDGRNEEVLKRAAPPPNLMADSPVYLLLQEILKLVTPLNLIDPGSPYFKSTRCQTLHDVTRFCHEKAVMEMFAFGEKAHFDARSAKQLGGDIPFQWWVIDLEDGFREGFDVHEKYVHMQDIASVPMQAIWEGMTARSWRGPPRLSARGFGSVLFRSTMNPSLEPAVGTSLGTKNYFLISRNFCNLSMRLGYHFTLVEAYLGSHLTENYVSFQFRGGAADRSRRFVRVYLLRDVLERYGFRVEVKHDALTARIEKKEKEKLIEGLKVLGYLLIHTRQIDMAMGEQDMVDHYRQQIMADLDAMVAPAAVTD